MTLTRLLPTLRRTIGDPLDPDRWPARTTSTPDDVVNAGVSLTRLAGLCGTPCVHTAAAAAPGTDGRVPLVIDGSILVLTVRALEPTVVLDAPLAGLPVTWREMRLLGRLSTAPLRVRQVEAAPDGVALPGDLRVGDLLAIPCRRPVALGELRAPVVG